ncbi:MAG TPA: hypothetical protein VFR85_11205 [Anaeromyxobacteraceae bacterium]|nr:hypothetical protein [Anaeromyxobacteraceae bacterium]
MLKLLKWGVAAAALWAVVAFVPVGGRTVLDRWRAASGPGDFVTRTAAEIERGVRRLAGRSQAPSREAQARSTVRPAPAARPGQPTPPAEHHTDADRKALDAIVAEHAR